MLGKICQSLSNNLKFYFVVENNFNWIHKATRKTSKSMTICALIICKIYFSDWECCAGGFEVQANYPAWLRFHQIHQICAPICYPKFTNIVSYWYIYIKAIWQLFGLYISALECKVLECIVKYCNTNVLWNIAIHNFALYFSACLYTLLHTQCDIVLWITMYCSALKCIYCNEVTYIVM